jgi:7,8-dihydropterin-6-yl-methyl-4-(beta-D-ribofuranosyl)aminobenzene 5'-phosphate synthase
MNLRKIIIMGLALVFIVSLHAPSQQQAQERKLELKTLPHVSITVLVDNMAGFGPVLGEWGLSYYIETDQHRILLDTGLGHVLIGNARALNVDLAKTNAVVISHAHDDHTDGLEQALQATGPVDLYLHPEAFITKYWKEGSLAQKWSMSLSREQLRGRVRKLVETKEPTPVCEGMMVTGQIPRVNGFEDTGVTEYAFLDETMKTQDPILDDQAVFFRTPEGLVILLGCGHSGLVNTMRYVGELLGEQRIYAVIGGTHLLNASPDRLQKTIEVLKEYDVQKIMLSHCTGVKAYAELAKAFPGRCSWPASGTRIEFGRQ